MNSGHPLFFRSSASFSKTLNLKSICYTGKIFRATLFFRASASCSKFLNDKKIFQFSEKFQDNSVFFSGQAQVAQKSCIIKNIYSVLWILGTLCFSVQAQVIQNSWMWKVYSMHWKISGQPCLQGKRSFLKILISKKYILYSEKFQWNSVFQGKRKLLKNRELWKNCQCSVYSLGDDLWNSG